MDQTAARKWALVLVHENAAILSGVNHPLPAIQGKPHNMMQLVRRIGHQVGVVVGRLNQYGLASGPQGLKLILEPDAATVAPDDIGEFSVSQKGHAVPGRRLSSGLPFAC